MKEKAGDVKEAVVNSSRNTNESISDAGQHIKDDIVEGAHRAKTFASEKTHDVKARLNALTNFSPPPTNFTRTQDATTDAIDHVAAKVSSGKTHDK